jgi:hypothetical protein
MPSQAHRSDSEALAGRVHAEKIQCEHTLEEHVICWKKLKLLTVFFERCEDVDRVMPYMKEVGGSNSAEYQQPTFGQGCAQKFRQSDDWQQRSRDLRQGKGIPTRSHALVLTRGRSPSLDSLASADNSLHVRGTASRVDGEFRGRVSNYASNLSVH